MTEEFDEIHAQVARYYTERVTARGDTPQGVDWKDGDSQRLRFEILSDVFRTRGQFSVLDVGCGTGAFLSYLRARGFRGVDYTGIDLSEKMLTHAREKFAGDPNVRFRSAAPASVGDRFDYVVSSGILNVKQQVSAAEWERYVYAIVGAQFAACRIGCAFNVLTSYADFTAPHLYYCDPRRMFDYCKQNLSRFITLRHDYPLYEFTMFVFREGRE